MALTAAQQKKLATLASQVVAGKPLTAKQQTTFANLTGKSVASPMPTVPAGGAQVNLPAQVSGGAKAATKGVGTSLGPKELANMKDLMAKQQSGASLTPQQQKRLTTLMGTAASSGQPKAMNALQGGNSTAGLNFNIPKELAGINAPTVDFSYTPQQVSAPTVDFSYTPQNVAAQAPGMENFDPGTLVDIASKLGLDFGDLTSGLTSEEYLAGQDPSYQFQQQQAQQAIERSAAARGSVLGGGTLKALQDRASQVAALDFQNAYARDLANRQLGLSQVQNEYGNEANTWAQNAGYDVSNRGMDLQAQMANQSAGLNAAGMSLQAQLANANNMIQAGIANQNAGLTSAGMSLQAQLANASNSLQARQLAQNMQTSQWDAQLQNRITNLASVNDAFNRDLAAKNFGLQGIQTAAGLQQNQFNNNMTGLNFGLGMLGGNLATQQAGIGYGTDLLFGNQAQQSGMMNNWLSNDWTSRNWQTGMLGNMLNTGYGASGTMSNNAMGRGGQAQNAASGYGSAGMQGALASGAAWGSALNGVNTAVQGGMNNYMLMKLLGGTGGSSSGGGNVYTSGASNAFGNWLA